MQTHIEGRSLRPNPKWRGKQAKREESYSEAAQNIYKHKINQASNWADSKRKAILPLVGKSWRF
jgi:hypothetical protein